MAAIKRQFKINPHKVLTYEFVEKEIPTVKIAQIFTENNIDENMNDWGICQQIIMDLTIPEIESIVYNYLEYRKELDEAGKLFQFLNKAI